jgi:hypothetical protein
MLFRKTLALPFSVCQNHTLVGRKRLARAARVTIMALIGHPVRLLRRRPHRLTTTPVGMARLGRGCDIGPSRSAVRYETRRSRVRVSLAEKSPL